MASTLEHRRLRSNHKIVLGCTAADPLFLVSLLAMQVKRRDKVIEFFDVYGAELHENSEWLKWFGKLTFYFQLRCPCSGNSHECHDTLTPFGSIKIALPYSKNPTTDPAFETFFSKQWLDNYIVSLHNFLNTIFQNMRE